MFWVKGDDRCPLGNSDYHKLEAGTTQMAESIFRWWKRTEKNTFITTQVILGHVQRFKVRIRNRMTYLDSIILPQSNIRFC